MAMYDAPMRRGPVPRAMSHALLAARSKAAKRMKMPKTKPLIPGANPRLPPVVPANAFDRDVPPGGN